MQGKNDKILEMRLAHSSRNLAPAIVTTSKSITQPICHKWNSGYSLSSLECRDDRYSDHISFLNSPRWQDRIVEYLDSLSDEELKKESKNESRNDALSLIIKVSDFHIESNLPQSKSPLCYKKSLIKICVAHFPETSLQLHHLVDEWRVEHLRGLCKFFSPSPVML